MPSIETAGSQAARPRAAFSSGPPADQVSTSLGHRSASPGLDDWRLLYGVGGVAAWVIVLLILVAIVAHVAWPPPPWTPGAAGEWFSYLQGNPLVGLINLDFAMEVGLVLSLPLYLALYIALRQDGHSLMLIGTVVALTGTLLHLLSNTALEMLMLSDAHATAATDAERAIYLGAGEGALSAYYGMLPGQLCPWLSGVFPHRLCHAPWNDLFAIGRKPRNRDRYRRIWVLLAGDRSRAVGPRCANDRDLECNGGCHPLPAGTEPLVLRSSRGTTSLGSSFFAGADRGT